MVDVLASHVSFQGGYTWMSKEVSKWLGSVDYNRNIPHLQVGETTHILTIDPITSNGTSKYLKGEMKPGNSIIRFPPRVK